MGGALPSGPRGRALALALTALALALLWFGLIAPLGAWYAERAERLRQDQTLLSHMTMLERTITVLKQQADAVAARRAAGRQEKLLDGATDGVAAATLQGLVESLARAAGTAVASAETLPAEPAGAHRAIAVRIALAAPWPTLVRLFAAIAAADSPIVVDNLQLHGPPRSMPEADWPIDASFTVTGYRAVQPAAAP
jgi:hypothetical protein